MVVEVWRVTKQTEAKGGVFSVVTKNKKCVIGGAEATSDRNRKTEVPAQPWHHQRNPQTQRQPSALIGRLLGAACW